MDRDRPVTRPDPGAVDAGGDPACWAHLVCDGCGRVLDPGEDHVCHDGDDGA